MLIRTILDSDEQGVIDLWSEVFESDAPHNDPSTALSERLAMGRDLFLVAEVGGTVVGSVMGGYDGHRGWIYAVAVAPAFRRRGIATALIRRLQSDLAVRGCRKVNLQVRGPNVGVVAFYKMLGFEVEDRVSMGKRLYE